MILHTPLHHIVFLRVLDTKMEDLLQIQILPLTLKLLQVHKPAKESTYSSQEDDTTSLQWIMYEDVPLQRITYPSDSNASASRGMLLSPIS